MPDQQPPNPGQPYNPYQDGQQNNPYQGGQPYPQGQYPQQGGYYAPPQPPKKRKIWPWVLLAIIIVIIAGIASCAALISGAVNEVDKESNEVVQVTYEITGDGPTGSATFTTGELDTAQETDIAIPWTKQVEVTGILKSVSLIATNGIEAQGSITCTIKQGDRVIVTNTSSGPGATASCSGDADDE
ncbi:hypothetical protein [Williamsia sp. DF01-3]|uniref:hypothetical protein n=1 Tax=Williamsia sp. DF01-3 TaxID=2934157 RepID=UPI001FF2F853|nr:hypothetical protein [Williamsia sp. DF01-3]MCK0517677.1 hypothetical protein [Williamsia sp. DF01-3]